MVGEGVHPKSAEARRVDFAGKRRKFSIFSCKRSGRPLERLVLRFNQDNINGSAKLGRLQHPKRPDKQFPSAMPTKFQIQNRQGLPPVIILPRKYRSNSKIAALVNKRHIDIVILRKTIYKEMNGY